VSINEHIVKHDQRYVAADPQLKLFFGATVFWRHKFRACFWPTLV